MIPHTPIRRCPVIPEPVLFGSTIALVLISIVMVYSTTGIVSHEKLFDTYYYVKRQAVGALIGCGFLIGFSYIPISFIKRAAPFLYALCIFLLALPLIPGLGDAAGGAKRWVVLGPIRFQPGEFVKLFYVIFLAGYFERRMYQLGSFKEGIVKPLLLVGLMGALFLLQPDFGSTAVLVCVTLGMAITAGVRIFHFFLCAITCASVLGVMVLISPYRMSRIVSFLDPFADPGGKGYQLIQSLIALASGSVLGKGIGLSLQKLFFLPAAHTDFIFSVVGEELGFIGCLALLGTFILFLWRGIRLTTKLHEYQYSSVLACGLTLLIVVPALLNVGVVSGLLPTKGMVLPLVGYGSSSLISSLMTVGILLGIERCRKEHRL